MTDWQSRIIQNDHPNVAIEDLPAEFVQEIRRTQIDANRGWAPDATDLIDRRIVTCPTCNAPGMNTCFGYWAFTCGGLILSDGEIDEPCGGEA